VVLWDDLKHFGQIENQFFYVFVLFYSFVQECANFYMGNSINIFINNFLFELAHETTNLGRRYAIPKLKVSSKKWLNFIKFLAFDLYLISSSQIHLSLIFPSFEKGEKEEYCTKKGECSLIKSDGIQTTFWHIAQQGSY
jgi:hypothetical protein